MDFGAKSIDDKYKHTPYYQNTYNDINNNIRITYEKDSKISYFGTITIKNEDHTIGNLVKM